MSKFKVGDRVRYVKLHADDPCNISNKLGEIATIVRADSSGYPYYVEFADGPREWMYSNQLRRLVPKRKPANPDRVMVAAILFQHAERFFPSGPLVDKLQSVLKLADALIAEGGK